MYPQTDPSDPGSQYAASRGISPATLASVGCRWDPEQQRIVIPVRGRSGSLFGFTGRATVPGVSPKVRDYAGIRKRWHVIGEHRWSRDVEPTHRLLIIVEGLFSYLHLIELNVEAVADVGCIMGSKLSDHQADIIIRNGAATYLLLDNDEAGDKGLFGRMDREGNRDWQKGAVGMLVDHVPVYVPEWPEAKDDPDQLTKRDLWTMLRFTPRHPRLEMAQPVVTPNRWS